MFTASLQDFLTYILRHLYGFFYFWYVGGTRDFLRRAVEILRTVEREAGVRINLRLITQPIFGDYSKMGRLVGPFFRLGRVLVGALLCFLTALGILLIFLVRLALPLIALYMIFTNLFFVLS